MATGSGELKCQHSSAVWWKKAMTGVSLIHSCALKGTVLTMSMTTSYWPTPFSRYQRRAAR